MKSNNRRLASVVVALVMAGSMFAAQAQKPTLLYPTNGTEVRGDGQFGSANVVRWQTNLAPSIVYVITVQALDETPAAAPVQFSFSPGAPDLVNEGGGVYSYPFNFNRPELQEFGSGRFRMTLTAQSFTSSEDSDPVTYFKGRPVAVASAANGNNPDAVTFSLQTNDPDNTPQYQYNVLFTRVSDNSTVGPFLAPNTASLTQNQSDFPTFDSTLLAQGADYTLRLIVTDTRPQNAADPGLASVDPGPLNRRTFHVNAKPVVTSITGPTLSPFVNDTTTNIDFTVQVDDVDDATATVDIEISLRTDDTFANGEPFTVVVDDFTVNTGTPTVISVPIPFTGNFWTVRARATDPKGIVSVDAPSANTIVDDVPLIGGITARYGAGPQQGTTPTGNRFDFTLGELVPPLDENSGVLETASVEFEGLNVTNQFGGQVQYTWEFGDGQQAGPSATPTATNTYAVAQRRTVTLTINDNYFSSQQTFDVIVNDEPRVEISGIDPGEFDEGQNAFVTTVPVPGGATIGIQWVRYNFVRDVNEDLSFSYDRTGTTIVCDRRGVDNVEFPTLDNLYFEPTGVPVAVPDRSSSGDSQTLTTNAEVPSGERLGPITDVDVVELTLIQDFTSPATDLCMDAPAIDVGTRGAATGAATDDGFSVADVTSIGLPSDECEDAPLVSIGDFIIDTSIFTASGLNITACDFVDEDESDLAAAAPLIGPGTYQVSTALALADGFSSCDASFVSATNLCGSAPSIAPGSYPVDTSGAVASGYSLCDHEDINGSDLCASGPAASPGSYSIDVTLATASGFSAADFLDVARQDTCASALEISPGTLTADTSAALADGYSDADEETVAAEDDCMDAPEVSPATRTVDTSAATADGDSTVDFQAVAATDDQGSALLLTPGTLAVLTGGATADGYSAADFMDLAGGDDCVDAVAISPGTLSVDTSGATADGSSTVDFTDVAGNNAFGSAVAVAPGTLTVDTSSATADGFASCDTELVTATDDCISAPSLSPGMHAIDTSGATADGYSTADFAAVVGADVFASALAIAPGTQAVDTSGATADGFTMCDVESSVTASDTCATAPAVSPGTFTLSTAGATADGESNSDPDNSALEADAIGDAVEIWPGTFTVNVSAATGDGDSSCDNDFNVGASDTISTAPTIGVGTYTGDTDLNSIADDGDSNCDASTTQTLQDVYYAYTLDAAGTLTVTVDGTSTFSLIAIYDAATADIANEVDCTFTTDTMQTVLSVAATTNTTYYIRVARVETEGAYTMTLTGPNSRKDAWYTYQPQASGTLTVTAAGSTTDTVLSVHTAMPGNSANELDCSVTSASQASLSVAVTAGTTYYIRMAGPIDESDEEFDVTIDGPGTRRDVWVAYTPQADGTADFTLESASTDSVLSVHSACGVVSADSDLGDGTDATVTGYAVTAGTTYLVRIAGTEGRQRHLVRPHNRRRRDPQGRVVQLHAAGQRHADGDPVGLFGRHHRLGPQWLGHHRA